MNDASDVHEAEQVQADFTFLRQISQGVNVRLSDPLQIPENDGHANLLAISNQNRSDGLYWRKCERFMIQLAKKMFRTELTQLQYVQNFLGNFSQ